ncbi:MAG: type II toxin-antitoxin system HicB family antitoxin [Candidatus Cybelea sp.]
MAPIVRDYTVILTLEPEVGGYSVTVPALPEVATQGESVEEALAMAREAINFRQKFVAIKATQFLPTSNHLKNASTSRSKPRKNP